MASGAASSNLAGSADAAYYAAAPELHRSRARAMCGLVATGAGVLAAGLVFAPASPDIPTAALVIGIAAVCLLVISVIAFGKASIYHKNLDERGKDAAEALVKGIAGWTKAGAWLAILALGCFVAMIITSLTAERETSSVEIALVGWREHTVRQVCPDLRKTFSATVFRDELVSDTPTISLRVSARDCDGEAQRWLQLSRETVVIASQGSP